MLVDGIGPAKLDKVEREELVEMFGQLNSCSSLGSTPAGLELSLQKNCSCVFRLVPNLFLLFKMTLGHWLVLLLNLLPLPPTPSEREVVPQSEEEPTIVWFCLKWSLRKYRNKLRTTRQTLRPITMPPVQMIARNLLRPVNSAWQSWLAADSEVVSVDECWWLL